MTLMIAQYSCQGCLSGQYSVSAGVCATCDVRCKTCSGSGVTNCTSCEGTDNRYLSGTTCSCNSGYFQVSTTTAACSACNSKCKTCSNSATNCTSCYGSSETVSSNNQYRTLSSFSCTCMSGYFDNGVDVCVICSYACSTCTGKARNCTLCGDANRQYLPYCDCKAGYYENTTTTAGCVACDTKCSTCRLCDSGDTCGTYSSICTSCAGLNRVDFDDTSSADDRCACQSGYYVTSASQLNCTRCPYECATCYYYSSTVYCLTCSSTTRNSTTQTFDDTVVTFDYVSCDCVDGYYLTTDVPDCSACPEHCATCTSSGPSCTTCTGTNRNTSNYCFCNSGYQEPSSGDDCEEICPSGQNRDSSNNCVCSDTYFYNSSSSACEACATPCLNCVNSSTNCLTCDTSITNSRNNPPTCGCLDGYFLNGTDCSPCNTTLCGTCSGSENTCLTCTGVARVDPPTCGCDSGYVDVSGVCQKCHYTCGNCTGTTASDCTNCVDSTTRDYSSGTCDCKAGYFETTDYKCEACVYYCATCELTSTNCLTCEDSTHRDSNDACRCTVLDGFYDDGSSSSCQACDSNCVNCYGTSTNCTSCATNRRSPPDCECNEGFYEDGSGDCTNTCSHPCRTCDDSGDCTSCLDPLYRGAAPDCDCLDGYVEVSNVCVVCNFKCETCSTDQTTCDTCKGLYRNLTASCACSDGYYQYLEEQDCRKCQYKCKTCSSFDVCTSVETGTNRNSSNSYLCNNGYFDNNYSAICVACNTTKCSTCTGTANGCLVCSDTTSRNISDSCECSTGYYEDASGVCQNCKTDNIRCETCVDDTQCLTCNTAHSHRNVSNNCLCEDGYYEDGSNLCQPCHYRCVTCDGGTSSDCLVCQDSTNREASAPCACKQGYYDDGSSALCQKCSYKCLNCTSFSVCTDGCSDSTRDSVPDCDCRAKYFDVNVSVCSACDYQCADCTLNSSNCGTCETDRSGAPTCNCDEGMVDVNQVCTDCSNYCNGCIGSITNCTLCQGDNRNQNPPTCSCMEGYYDDINDSSEDCLPCDKQCRECSLSASNCTSCKINGTNRLSNAPACDCHELFYEDPADTVGICAECPRNCGSCDTSGVCTSCIHSTTRQSTAPDCDCLSGYWETGLKDCLRCHLKCDECSTDVNTCTTCTSSGGSTRSTVAPGCSCNSGYYEVGLAACAACAFQCAECQGTSTNCTSCIDGANRETASSCECVDGTYEGGYDYCSECPIKCSEEYGCNDSAQCLVACKPNRNISNSCACNTGYHDLSLGQFNLGLQACKLDCEASNCEFLQSQYSVTDDIDEQIYSHYSFSRQENIYSATYVQVYALGFSEKVRIFGLTKSTSAPVNTEIIAFDGSDFTGFTINSLSYVPQTTLLAAGSNAKLYLMNLTTNTTEVVTNFGGTLTIAIITHIITINNTDSILFSASNGYIVWFNTTDQSVTQSYLIKASLYLKKFDYDGNKNVWIIGTDNNIYVQSILRASQKQTLKANHSADVQNILITSKYCVSISEVDFLIYDLQTFKLLSKQSGGGGVYSDVIKGTDIIGILHTSPIIDFQIYNLTDFNVQTTNLFTKRHKIYELQYEKDDSMIGPFYDTKISTQLGSTTYSTYADAKTACEADSSCKSIYYHQDNNRLTNIGQFYILGTDTVPVDLTASELAEAEVRAVYIKNQVYNNYLFYSKSSNYFVLKTQIEQKTEFIAICGDDLYMELRPNYYYQGFCTSSCRGETEPDYLTYNNFCSNRCESGYVYRNSACTKCPHKCALECDSSLTCLDACRGDRVLSDSCTCPAGKFEDGLREYCQDCQPKCQTCTTNSSNCLTCSGNRFEAPACECLEGYFDDGVTPECRECFSPYCAKCKNSGANQCTQCKDGYFFSPESEQSDQGTCYDECPDGYKKDKDAGLCVPSKGVTKEAATIIVLGTVVTALVGTTSFVMFKTGLIGAQAAANQAGAAQAYTKVGQNLVQQQVNSQPLDIQSANQGNNLETFNIP